MNRGDVMRLVLAMVLAGLVALPLRVSAQDDGVGGTSQLQSEEHTSSEEPASEEGALSPRLRKRTRQQWDPDTYELRLDSSGVSLSPPPAPRRKTDARLRQYRQGVIVSSVFIGIGGALIGSGVVVLRRWQEEECLGLDCDLIPPGGTFVLFSLGAVAALGGLIGAAVSGSKLGARKRKLRELQQAHHRTRRMQWDLARSRLVF
jgi:hypothetical protein